LSSITLGFGNVVWCDFPNRGQAILPEFRETHPAIIVSTQNAPSLPFLVVPMSTTAQTGDDPGVLYWSPSPLPHSQESWVVASHIYAVALDRLKPIFRQRKPVKLGKDRIEELKVALSQRLPLGPVGSV